MTSPAQAFSLGLRLLGWSLLGGSLLPAAGCGGVRPAAATAAEEERIAVRVADEVLERLEREGLLDPEACECAGTGARGGR